MVKYARVHTPVLEDELGGLTLHVGQRFPIVERPDSMEMYTIFTQMARQGLLGNTYVVHFGDGIVIFPKEPNEHGMSIHTWFDIEEEESPW